MKNRRLAKQSPIRDTHYLYSHKTQRSVYFDSLVEQNLAVELEFDPEVVSYQTQPFSEQYLFDGKRRRYTPDTMIEWTNDECLVEVKTAEEAAKPDFKYKFELLRQHFATQGRRLVVVTDQDLNVGQRPQNLSFLYRFLQYDIDSQALNHLKCEFPTGGTLGDLSTHLSRTSLDLGLVYQAIAQRHASIDLHQPRTLNTLVHWS